MTLLKEAVIQRLEKLPDSATAEDIMCVVHFLVQVLDGIEDAEAGRLITTGNLLAKVDQWGK